MKKPSIELLTRDARDERLAEKALMEGAANCTHQEHNIPKGLVNIRKKDPGGTHKEPGQ